MLLTPADGLASECAGAECVRVECDVGDGVHCGWVSGCLGAGCMGYSLLIDEAGEFVRAECVVAGRVVGDVVQGECVASPFAVAGCFEMSEPPRIACAWSGVAAESEEVAASKARVMSFDTLLSITQTTAAPSLSFLLLSPHPPPPSPFPPPSPPSSPLRPPPSLSPTSSLRPFADKSRAISPAPPLPAPALTVSRQRMTRPLVLLVGKILELAASSSR
mmetsp:Transcript_81198/g.118903  ORF Transcript_81198/g.118903 Transcript_81198/m.118903 type:complete len:219 (-) Transcript_81198:56-712(-)